MRRFLFGVVVGVLLVLFFQARGAEFLRGLGIDPERISQRMEEIQGKLLKMIQTSKEAGGQATGPGEKIREKLKR